MAPAIPPSSKQLVYALALSIFIDRHIGKIRQRQMRRMWEKQHGGRESQNKYTIKGGSRRAEKSRKVLMMMKAAKLGWAGSGAGPQ